MAWVAISENAERHMEELIDDRGADEHLIARLQEYFAEISERPASMTEPAKYPYTKRLMVNFELNDATARRWRFTVTLRRAADEEGIIVLTVNGAPSPLSFDD